MEEMNFVTNEYWSDNDRFADLSNAVFFDGRDILKGEDLLIGLENQSAVYYAMPVRIMGYDFLGYEEQLKKLRKEHRRKKDLK